MTHGTASGYKHGCRCVQCRVAWTAHMRDSPRRRGHGPPLKPDATRAWARAEQAGLAGAFAERIVATWPLPRRLLAMLARDYD